MAGGQAGRQASGSESWIQFIIYEQYMCLTCSRINDVIPLQYFINYFLTRKGFQRKITYFADKTQGVYNMIDTYI